MDRVVFLKALAHSTRLYMVESLLSGREKCICEFMEELKFDQSTISKHMAILRNAGLVISRKEGLNVYYKLVFPPVKKLFELLEEVDGV